MSDDRSRTIGVICLGSMALLALAGMVACAVFSLPVPASLSAAFGTASGALAGTLLPPTNRE